MPNTLLTNVPPPRATAAQVASLSFQRYQAGLEEAQRRRDASLRQQQMALSASSQSASLAEQRRAHDEQQAIADYNAQTRRLALDYKKQLEKEAAERRAGVTKLVDKALAGKKFSTNPAALANDLTPIGGPSLASATEGAAPPPSWDMYGDRPGESVDEPPPASPTGLGPLTPVPAPPATEMGFRRTNPPSDIESQLPAGPRDVTGAPILVPPQGDYGLLPAQENDRNITGRLLRGEPGIAGALPMGQRDVTGALTSYTPGMRGPLGETGEGMPVTADGMADAYNGPLPSYAGAILAQANRPVQPAVSPGELSDLAAQAHELGHLNAENAGPPTGPVRAGALTMAPSRGAIAVPQFANAAVGATSDRPLGPGGQIPISAAQAARERGPEAVGAFTPEETFAARRQAGMPAPPGGGIPEGNTPNVVMARFPTPPPAPVTAQAAQGNEGAVPEADRADLQRLRGIRRILEGPLGVELRSVDPARYQGLVGSARQLTSDLDGRASSQHYASIYDADNQGSLRSIVDRVTRDPRLAQSTRNDLSRRATEQRSALRVAEREAATAGIRANDRDMKEGAEEFARRAFAGDGQQRDYNSARATLIAMLTPEPRGQQLPASVRRRNAVIARALAILPKLYMPPPGSMTSALLGLIQDRGQGDTGSAAE